jgi:hypothetical protein
MKTIKTLGCLIVSATLALGLSTAAFAASKNQGNFTLNDPVRLGSTDLKAGQYKAEWTPQSGNAVKVDILKNGKVVASTTGTLKSLNQPSPYDAVVTKPLDSNIKTIDEIDFSNRKEALVIGE